MNAPVPLARPFPPGSRPLAAVAAALAVLLAIAVNSQTVSAPEALPAYCIVLAAFLPLLLWSRNPERFGLPVLPVWALTFAFTFGFAFLSPNEESQRYDAAIRTGAAWLVALFVAAIAAVWQAGCMLGEGRRPLRILSLDHRSANPAFLAVLALSPAHLILNDLGLVALLGPLGSVVRALVLGSFTLAVFFVGHRIGSGSMTPRQVRLAAALFILYCVVNLSSLFLIGVMLAGLFLSAGYFLGSGRVPWLFLVGMLSALGFLHAGKEEMRYVCWSNWAAECPAAPRYLARIERWVDASYRALGGGQRAGIAAVTGGSILDRASLTQHFLRVYTLSPQTVPYLGGSTYAILPKMLVPRIVNPQRGSTHEGTTLLNIHYGLQAREETVRTTIGWGLLNEAYANFGVTGLFGLAAILGGFLTWAGLSTRGYPVLSFRALFCMILIGLASQTEVPASVFVTAFLHAFAALVLIRVWLMRSYRRDGLAPPAAR